MNTLSGIVGFISHCDSFPAYNQSSLMTFIFCLTTPHPKSPHKFLATASQTSFSRLRCAASETIAAPLLEPSPQNRRIIARKRKASAAIILTVYFIQNVHWFCCFFPSRSISTQNLPRYKGSLTPRMYTQLEYSSPSSLIITILGNGVGLLSRPVYMRSNSITF